MTLWATTSKPCPTSTPAASTTSRSPSSKIRYIFSLDPFLIHSIVTHQYMSDIHGFLIVLCVRVMMWLQLILYNRAVVSSKLGMDHYSLADLFKATNL